MYLTLAIFAGIVGLAIAGASLYTAWYAFHFAKSNEEEKRPKGSALDRAAPYLLRWTALDYAGLLLACMGLVFLLADLIGVMRERDSYPYYHYGYIACAFVFMLIALLFLLTRLSLVLRLARKERAAAPHDGDEPNEADHSE